MSFLKTNPDSAAKYLVSSTAFFAGSILAGLLLIMLLNGGLVNQILTPVLQYVSLFLVLWDDNPAGALRFILSKTVIAFAHKDPRSGLNLWTYEFDTLSLLVYILVAIFGSSLLRKLIIAPRDYRWAAVTGLTGCALTLFSVSYLTAIEHCSGATWAGFVALYGLGFNEFEIYTYWQWLCAGLGVLAMATGWWLARRRSLRTNRSY